VNAAPEIVALEMLTAEVPVLVKFTVCVPVTPTAMLPKLRLVEPGVSTPAPGVDAPGLEGCPSPALLTV
jgi:hypothetical protein